MYQSFKQFNYNWVGIIARKPKSKLCEVDGDSKSNLLRKVWKMSSTLNRKSCDFSGLKWFLIDDEFEWVLYYEMIVEEIDQLFFN